MPAPPQERNIGRGFPSISADATGDDRLTGTIIGSAFRIMNTLGPDFLEKIYENALAHELRKAGLKVSQQQGIAVHYDGIILGEYVADLVIQDKVRECPNFCVRGVCSSHPDRVS